MEALLADALEDAWTRLAAAAGNRHNPMHVPVVASVGVDGLPSARVMVLRAVDREAATLRFHTDARSPKCAELDGRAVAVLAYEDAAAVQLRVSGVARVLREGAEVDAIWAAATPFARRIYLVEATPGSPLPGPGSGLPAAVAGRKPDEAELVPARANFAIVTVAVRGIDWLHLAQGGHRRAVFGASDGWAGQWVVP